MDELRRLAELAVGIGANVQPGQVVEVLPSEEIHTSPDRDRVDGHVPLTHPAAS